MFVKDDIVEFMNKIINQVSVGEEASAKENLGQFRSYLELTKMCDEKTLERMDKVLECFDSLVDLKAKLGFVDVSSLFHNAQQGGKKLTKRMERPKPQARSEYEDKHYRHYSSSYPSSYPSESYSSGCGGGGSSYRSGC